ncbi:MAG TPA: hypothetical protein DHV59_01520 [Oxalobacteraceae bacterium]|nr:hypothetical protein [Oxalobacteraceae bacterium]
MIIVYILLKQQHFDTGSCIPAVPCWPPRQTAGPQASINRLANARTETNDDWKEYQDALRLLFLAAGRAVGMKD